jgi:isopentenyl diphosphate isomerase/L-lactate dehydrogenase-like FMN-dependent dehydrogenase
MAKIAMECTGITDNTARRLRDNEAAFDRYKIRPRVLVNVDNIDTSSELFGKKVGKSMGLYTFTC